MQAIITKYLPATNTKGSRIKAVCERGSVTIPFNHSGDSENAHRLAVQALVAKFVAEDSDHIAMFPEDNPWNRPFVSGQTNNDGPYVHVFLS